MDNAIHDGVYVLSLSLGGSEHPCHANLISNGGFVAMEIGIFVTWVSETFWLAIVGAESSDRGFMVDVLLRDGETYASSSL